MRGLVAHRAWLLLALAFFLLIGRLPNMLFGLEWVSANNAPVANNDAYSALLNTPRTISAPGVLGNDTDADGNTLTAHIVANVAHGILTLNTNGSFTYTPANGFQGDDSFTYTANDGTSDSNIATVTILVGDVPPFANDDHYNAVVGVQLNVSAPGILGNDSAAIGRSLTVDLINVLELPPPISSLSPLPDGSFQYLANSAGTDVYTYQANDGTSDSNTATITFHVDTAPVANNDQYETPISTPLTVAAPQGVLANDTDTDNDPLTAVLVNGPANGVVTLNPDGSFTYTPAFNFGGSDSFTYRANDGITNSSPATVSIKIDRAPVASDDVYATPNNTPLTVAADGVLSNDTDVDGDTLTAVIVAQPDHGSVILNADGSFTYTPAPGFPVGIFSFTYKANDGLLDSNTTTVTIYVGDSTPVAVNDTYSTKRDTALNVDAAQGVLANDTDADIGDTLTAHVVTPPGHGALTLNSDGSFIYTPVSNFFGSDSFTYEVNDGTVNSNLATVTIQVNHAPVAVADSYAVNLDTALHIAAPGILGNDTDADGDTLSAILITQPAHGTMTLNANGSFTYTPNLAYNGVDSFTYRANDGAQNSNVATVTLTVTALPAATDDRYYTTINTALHVSAPGILGNDSGNALTAILVTDVSHGTLTPHADGSFIYTPNSNFTGTDHFTYKANNGAFDSNVATVTIHVIGTSPAGAAPERNTFTTLPIILAWGRVIGAVGYEIEVSTDKTFNGTPLVDVTTTTPEPLYLSVSSLANGHYYWRVRAKLSSTSWSAWTVVDSFTVAT